VLAGCLHVTLVYPATTASAEAVQRALAERVRLLPLPPRPARVAGAAIRTSGQGRLAGAALLTFPGLEVIEQTAAPLTGASRYRPGLRAFSEGEALLQAVLQLRQEADVVFFRGHGICHPRHCGLASHLGVLLDRPTVGCADALLFGQAEEPGPARGDWSPILGERGELLGAALRTRTGRRPLYVSPGHRCDVESAVALTLACAPRFRLPEPLRAARTVGTS
jgi:deoxyribonuclease V